MFSWTDEDLNQEQEDAILDPNSIFLKACPGSGKTRTLIYKIALELSNLNSSRKFVIAITYTHRAADEIKDRISQFGLDTSRLWIGTIHSFCLEWILKPYSIYLPELENGYSLIDQHEREVLLTQLCQPYRNPRITHFDCEYYVTEKEYFLGCTDQRKHQGLHEIISSYFEVLRETKKIDFELILWHSYQLIHSVPKVSSLLSKLFSIILVDEYQDTKKIQYSIITSILKSGAGETRLFMVGDPNQAIYSSLGGYPIPINELRNLSGIPITERELSLNYRSSSRIVDFFTNFNLDNTNINAVGENHNYPSLITYDQVVSRDNLVNEITNAIRHNIDALGISPSEICVLAPQWIPLASMTRSLVISMPDQNFNGPGMVPFARDIENFWYKLSRIALTDPSPAMYIRRLRWAGETLTDLADVGAHISNISRKDLLRLCNGISINEANGLNFLERFFSELFSLLDVNFSDFRQLEEHHNAFFESSRSRITRLENEGLDQISELSFFKRTFQNSSGITVSTVHGSKGAEFDVVIAFALLEGMVPHFNDVNGDSSSQKMLYVIGSRARKNLHLFSESDRPRGKFGVYKATNRLARCLFDYDDM